MDTQMTAPNRPYSGDCKLHGSDLMTDLTIIGPDEGLGHKALAGQITHSPP